MMPRSLRFATTVSHAVLGSPLTTRFFVFHRRSSGLLARIECSRVAAAQPRRGSASPKFSTRKSCAEVSLVSLETQTNDVGALPFSV